MQVEIGKIYDGIVRNITKYGAFVDVTVAENEKVMGMVHISEISRSFVNEVRDFVKEGQNVKVKVIGINEVGKISLSMKQTEPEEPRNTEKNNAGRPQRSGNGRPAGGNRDRDRVERVVWDGRKKTPPEGELTFEDMLNRFKQNSEEKMGDIKRITERKNRSRRK